MRLTLLIGSVFCLTAVAFGAFGAHALEALLELNQRTSVYELANRYHFYHGLGLLAIAGIAGGRFADSKWIVLPLSVGTMVFCGSLYALALTNWSILGAITPIGGVLLLTGWSTLVFQIARN